MAILKSLNNLLPEVEEQEYRLVNKQRLQGKLLSERFQVFSVVPVQSRARGTISAKCQRIS